MKRRRGDNGVKNYAKQSLHLMLNYEEQDKLTVKLIA